VSHSPSLQQNQPFWRQKTPFNIELHLPEFDNLISQTNKILTRWPDVSPPVQEKNPDILVQKLRQAIQNWQWEGMKVSFITRVAHLIFGHDGLVRKDWEDLRQFYYREIAVSNRSSLLGAMFSLYLASFSVGSQHTQYLAKALSRTKQYLSARWQALLASFPDILNPTKIIEVIAQDMLGAENPWNALRSKGMRSPHAPGLMNEAHLSFTRKIKPHLDQRHEMERFIAWLKPEERHPAKQAGAGVALSALLEPWLKADPHEEDKEFLTKKIIELYGDPRVARGGVWSEVEESCLDVLLRWLTGATIHFFLDVISYAEESHMWEPRRKFWLYLYEKGRIQAAWAAFSDEAVRIARKNRNHENSQSDMPYGRQTAARQNTSLLIMKIDNKIIVEGSHSYKVQIFKKNNEQAPRLYQRRYDCEEIRNDSDDQIRHAGNWQSKVMERIW